MPQSTAASIPPPAVVPPLPNTHGAAALYQHILALTEPKDASRKQALLYGLTPEPLYLSTAMAKQILSLDEQGQPVRQTITGNSVVCRVGDVFYKLYPAAPGLEYAVHTLHEALGQGLSAPTRLLVIRLGGTGYTVQASLAVAGLSFEDLLGIAPALQRLKAVTEKRSCSNNCQVGCRGDYWPILCSGIRNIAAIARSPSNTKRCMIGWNAHLQTTTP